MADVEFDAFEDDGAGFSTDDPRVASALINWIGALMSLGLVAGLAVWAYKLTIRDVTDVPVIRALEGPMRVQPPDPGGTQAAHQGLAVNRVQADGEVAPPPGQVVLAPEPVDLFSTAPIRAPQPDFTADTPTDVATPADRTEGAARPAATAPASPDQTSASDPDAGLAPGDARGTLSSGVEAALAEAQGVAPEAAAAAISDQTRRTSSETASQGSFLTPVVPLSVPGVKRTSLPMPRPSGGYEAAVEQRAQVEAQVRQATIDIDPANLPVGTRLVQLGAYDSVEIARARWDDFAARYATYMENRQRVVQAAQSGGRTFYRLRVAGFDGLSDARRFCSVILADGGACIPVTHR